MPDSDLARLTAARERVLNWGPHLHEPHHRAEHFRRDVDELERLAARWALWNAAASPGEDLLPAADPVIARYSDGRVWSPEDIGDALAAVAAAVKERGPRPIRPLPDHRGRMWSDGGPWTCTDCGWVEGDPPREHGEEPAT